MVSYLLLATVTYIWAQLGSIPSFLILTPNLPAILSRIFLEQHLKDRSRFFVDMIVVVGRSERLKQIIRQLARFMIWSAPAFRMVVFSRLN